MTRDGDVAVIGLGSIGSMALWRLAERGVDAHGYERFGVGHHRGAAGGQSRRFSSLSLRDLRSTPLALDALDMWHRLEKASGRDLLTLTGGLVLGPQGTPALAIASRSAVESDLEHEHLDADALRHRFPQHTVSDGDVGLVDRLSGFVRPELSVVTATEVARAAGATVHDYTRVVGVEPDGDGVVVRLHTGERRYRAAILAPGAWAAQMVPVVGQSVVPRRLVQAWYVPRDVSAYAPEKFPVFERVGDINAYGFPTLDGATIKVAVYTRTHPVVDDVEHVDTTISLDDVRAMRDEILQFLTGLSPDPVTLSLHIEGYTDDAAPIVGELPGLPGVWTACGFSGSGFKFAPTMGDIVADLLIEGGTDRDIAHMSPDRMRAAQPQGSA